MKVSELLNKKRDQWQELDRLCQVMAGAMGFSRRRVPPEIVLRFSQLHRSAIADLALAEAYQLPPDVTEYLRCLVARAHSQLYRRRSLSFRGLLDTVFRVLPQKFFTDRCLWLAFFIFWGTFFGSGLYAYYQPGFAEHVVGEQQLAGLQEMYSFPAGSRPMGDDDSGMMFGYYVFNNAGIGLRVFALGLAFGVGGMVILLINASHLGTMFGYMATTEQSGNFFHFVTAHGPFELTAIVLAAGAGMRLGFSIVYTSGFTRRDSLREASQTALPAIGVAVAMFGVAALIEAFVSPSVLPYWVKAAVAVLSTVLLFLYFFVLGWPRKEQGEVASD